MELEEEIKEKSVPFNVDCWNISPQSDVRILTHFHKDHIPCLLPSALIVPFEVKYVDSYSEHQYNIYAKDIKEKKSPFEIKEVARGAHLNTTVPILSIKFKEKIAIIIGDYDPPAADTIIKCVKTEKPDFLIIPAYAKKVSNKKGRLLEKPTNLSDAQKYIIREVRKIKKVFGKPVIITLAHSKKAERLPVDIHIEYNQKIPSLLDYQSGVVECNSYDFCEKCKRQKLSRG